MREGDDECGGDVKRRMPTTTPVAMVLHLDEEEEEEEEEDDDDDDDDEEEEDEEDEEDEEEEEEEDEEEDDDDEDTTRGGADEEEETVVAEDDEVDGDDEEGDADVETFGGVGEEVCIDVQGRIAGVSDCGLDFSFRSFPDALMWLPSTASTTTDTSSPSFTALSTKKKTSENMRKNVTSSSSSSSSKLLSSLWNLEMLVADCEAAFVGESFWIGATSTPRCALESIALAVFRQHTKEAVSALSTMPASVEGDGDNGADGGGGGGVGVSLPSLSGESGVGFHPSRSGAEWWVQLRHADDGEKETVSFHWDKDEDLVDDYGVNVHPAISTVTYLTDTGAPTLVLNHRAPTMYEDLDGFRGEVLEGYISYPRAGKHVAFDGRLLHGAPRDLTRAGDVPPGYKRVSFLVNVWLDYKPRGVDPFPEEELDHLNLSPPLGPTEERAIEAGFRGRTQRGRGGEEGEGVCGATRATTAGAEGNAVSMPVRREGGADGGSGAEDCLALEVVSSPEWPQACTVFEYAFGETGMEHLLRVPVPLGALGACRGDVVELRFGGVPHSATRAEVVAQQSHSAEKEKYGGKKRLSGLEGDKREGKGSKKKKGKKGTKKPRAHV